MVNAVDLHILGKPVVLVAAAGGTAPFGTAGYRLIA
jgi:hypothetical protein